MPRCEVEVRIWKTLANRTLDSANGKVLYVMTDTGGTDGKYNFSKDCSKALRLDQALLPVRLPQIPKEDVRSVRRTGHNQP